MPETHNTKNFMAHGGNELVIGGKLTFLPGALVEGGEGLFDGGEDADHTLPIAGTETLGGVRVGSGLSITEQGILSADGVTPAAAQPDSEATTIAGLKEDFNALLAALRTAGLLATAAEEPSGNDPETGT